MVMDMVAWQGTPHLVGKVMETGRWHAVVIFVSHVTLEHDLNLARFLRQRADCPPLVLMGPVAHSLETAPDGVPADVVILGEPEKVLLEAHESVFSTTKREAPRFVGAGGDGLIEDLDGLPFPAWDLVPPGKGGFLTVYSSKGCGRHCAYCPYIVAQGNRVRSRSLEGVIQEIEWLTKSFSIRRVVFRDIAFAAHNDRVEALCQALIKKKLALRWECESHPMDFRPGLLDLMKKAGCTEIKVGLETAHPRLLQEWGRVGSPEEAEEYLVRVAQLLEACKRTGLRCHVFLMVGAPGQGRESLQATLSYLLNVRPQLINVKLFHPYPGIAMATSSAESADPGEAHIFAQRLQSCQAPAKHRLDRVSFPFLRPFSRGFHW
jgi:radical SAM superfamily enzyme YgiQ (UPF0313 family)